MRTLTAVWLLAAMLAAGLWSGCGSTKKEYDYWISYVDSEQTQTVQMGYEPQSTTVDGMIQEFLAKLATDTDTVGYVKAIPEGVNITDWKVDQDCLNLDFNSAYSKLDPITEILCRLAIVRTMTQIEGINSMSFTVKGEPLTDSKGNAVGRMTNDSFVENPGEQIHSFQNATIELYFANEAGDALVKETQEVHYNSNISMEKLVMEHLLTGPKGSAVKRTIPEETKLLNISVVDGSCYVNLDESFLNQNYEIEGQIVIYSIVNSLTALGNIRQVQIAVNGDTSITYRDRFPLSKMYEPDDSYVKELGVKATVIDKEDQTPGKEKEENAGTD